MPRKHPKATHLTRTYEYGNPNLWTPEQQLWNWGPRPDAINPPMVPLENKVLVYNPYSSNPKDRYIETTTIAGGPLALRANSSYAAGPGFIFETIPDYTTQQPTELRTEPLNNACGGMTYPVLCTAENALQPMPMFGN